MIVQELIGYLKTKPMGRVEVVQDENEDTSVGDDVFKVSELVKPYRIAPSIDLEENLNFYIFDNSVIDVDAEELNVVLNSSWQAQVDEDDDKNVIKLKIAMELMTIQLKKKKD